MTKVQKLDANGDVIKVGDYGYYHNEGYNFFVTVFALSCKHSELGIEICDDFGDRCGWIYAKDFHITKPVKSAEFIKQAEAEEQKFTFAEIKEVWDAWHISPAKHPFLEFFVKNTDPEYKEYLRLKAKFE